MAKKKPAKSAKPKSPAKRKRQIPGYLTYEEACAILADIHPPGHTRRRVSKVWSIIFWLNNYPSDVAFGRYCLLCNKPLTADNEASCEHRLNFQLFKEMAYSINSLIEATGIITNKHTTVYHYSGARKKLPPLARADYLAIVSRL